MLRRLVLIGFALLMALPCATGQSGPTLVDVAYARTVPYIAPGQVVRLHLSGLKIIPTSLNGDRALRAISTPLPSTLGDISVIVRQYYRQVLNGPLIPVGPFYASLLSINQITLCPSSVEPECIITVITAQMPFELAYDARYTTHVSMLQNGVESQSFGVNAVGELIHVVTTDDNGEGVPLTGANLSPGQSVVTHADGTPVAAFAPAKPGEVVVIYTWGLGNTVPAVKTGVVTPAPAPLVPSGVGIRFDFHPNAGPTKLLEAQEIASAYLTPGQVGLYQVNVQLPSVFPIVQSCSGSVESNLTITVSSAWSSDGAAICVEPPR
jgi:uncharacterized protein (TIGR03437 family)